MPVMALEWPVQVPSFANRGTCCTGGPLKRPCVGEGGRAAELPVCPGVEGRDVRAPGEGGRPPDEAPKSA
jgi:hypothetical protein